MLSLSQRGFLCVSYFTNWYEKKKLNKVQRQVPPVIAIMLPRNKTTKKLFIGLLTLFNKPQTVMYNKAKRSITWYIKFTTTDTNGYFPTRPSSGNCWKHLLIYLGSKRSIMILLKLLINLLSMKSISKQKVTSFIKSN